MTSIFVYALAVNWLFILPGYHSTLARFGLFRQPFNCVFCITFWFTLIAVTFSPPVGLTFVTILTAAASAFVATFIQKAFNALPTSI